MTPRLDATHTPSPQELAAKDEAAKGYELEHAGIMGGGVLVGPGWAGHDPDSVPSPITAVEADDAVPVFAVTDKPVPVWRQMLEVYASNRLAVLSTIVLGIIVLGCFIGPHFYVTNQTNENLLTTPLNAPPSAAHWLGTDDTGWDELGRIMYSGQYSLILGALAGVITILVGTAYGMVSGFFGGFLDAAMMRLVDAALSIPYLFLLIALLTIFHNTNTFLILIIGLTGWFGNARIIRSDALAIRDLEYSQAAVSMGARRLHVIRRHVFPNSISNIVTVGTFSIADAILALSALGFIGFGIQAPAVDWGTVMSVGSQELINGYWWEIYPCAAVFVVVIVCINYMGDALRDIFEVRLRQR
jgi:peptide/nickel transport system permease protein